MRQLPDQVRDYIGSRSDEELITYIVTGIETYEPEAVEFAREEFHRRRLDPEIVSRIESAVVAKVQSERTATREAAERPLDTGEKMAAFACGLFVFRIFMKSEKLRNAGEDRRSAETLKFGCAGFITMLILIIVFLLLKSHW